jgi:shikimate kinase
MAPQVVLVGPPGAGKTTTGRALAEILGVAFRDTDQDVETAAGMPVSEIFFQHGEEHFRELERAAVAAAVDEHDGVLALGGGSVLDESTRRLLATHRVAFLDVGLPDAARRVGFNRDRPLLLGNPRAQWKQLMEARRPLYDEVATVTVPTDGLTPAEAAQAVADRLDLEGAPQ